MKTLTLYCVSIALLGFVTIGLTETVVWEPCDDSIENEELTCTVHEVRVEPCREAANKAPCRIRRGQTASISFDFTPNFAGNNLMSRAYWATDFADLPFSGMNSNACNSTPCPAIAGTRQTYNYSLPISHNYDTRTYNVKWKLWNPEDKECCFVFQIELVR